MVLLEPVNASVLGPPRDVAVLQPRSRAFGAGLDRAAATLATWLELGDLQPTGTAWFAQRITGPETDLVGLLAVIDARATGDDRLLPHEQVFAEPVARRVVLHRALGIEPRPSLILLPQGSGADLAIPLRTAFGGNEPSLVDPNGLRQSVAPLPNDVGASMARAMTGMPALLADGHHRVAAALDPMSPARGWTLALIVPPRQGRVLWPVHRVLRRLAPGITDPAVHAQRLGFRLTPLPAGSLEIRRAHDLTPASPPRLITATGAWEVTGGPRGWQETMADPVRDLPVSLAHALASALGAGDRRDSLGTAQTPHDAIAEVASGAPAALLVGGPDLAQVWRAAESGVRMPPKATWFQPKPLGGFVVRHLDNRHRATPKDQT